MTGVHETSAVVAGLLCSAAILVPTLIFVVVRVVEFRRSATEHGARCAWTVRCKDVIVASGQQYRYENWEKLDDVAADVLSEWFDSRDGELELARDGKEMHYSCTVQVDGKVGRSWG